MCVARLSRDRSRPGSGVCVCSDQCALLVMMSRSEVFVVALPLTLAPRPEFCDKFEAFESRQRSAGTVPQLHNFGRG